MKKKVRSKHVTTEIKACDCVCGNVPNNESVEECATKTVVDASAPRNCIKIST
jgi:hypothetical protein